MKKFNILVILLLIVVNISSCSAMFGPTTPKSFSVNEPGWVDMELRQDLERETLLTRMTEVITRENYEPEIISKDTGYLRTKWKYGLTTGGGKIVDYYRTRITLQISTDYTKVSINCEANLLEKGMWGETYWTQGTDTQVLEDIKDAIKGVVGKQ
ncbi:MAG: hypothetical protein ACOCV8_06055 [Spirochaetota bacterium]